MRTPLPAAVLAVLAAAPAPAARHDAEKLPVTRIRDLHYGDALFYFYQDEEFEALTRLLAYEHWNRVPHHLDEAQLLEGGLYLSLGMHNEAGERFALGVALVRNGRRADADPFLTAVGSMIATTPELLARKGRASLALGFAYLQANQPARARSALARVRLNGPYSNKALLGTGWALASLGDYQGALTPWMELRSRDLLDAAVQESYLAIPYAFAKLNANAQSAEYYESAVNSFDAESGRIDAAIARIRNGDMLQRVLTSEQGARYGWFWQLKNLPDAPESRYLYAVLAGHDFQEGLKNYRDLLFLNGALGRWDESM